MNDLTPYIGNARYDALHGQIYLARATGYSQRTCRKYVAEGKLPGYFMGRNLILPKEDFITYLSGDFVPAPPPTPLQTITSLIKHRDTRASA